MEQGLLSAALIVKNEERYLPACLESLQRLRPLLSEICIYDTGSTDSTIEIAHSFGATVVQGYWDHDFARARNEAIAMCTSKWILNIDADERVVADQDRLRLALREALQNPQIKCVQVTMIDIDLETLEERRKWLVPKVLRAGKMVYEGEIHEALVPRNAIGESKFIDPGQAVIAIKHVGYTTGEVMEQKGERNLEISSRIDLETADARELLNLARSFRLAGDVDNYVEYLQKAWNVQDGSLSCMWAGEFLSLILAENGRTASCVKVLAMIESMGSNADFVTWVRAKMEMNVGNYRRAKQLLDHVDKPAMAGTMLIDVCEVVEARMIANIETGNMELATACCIQLVGSHGKCKFSNMLAALWGAKDVNVLVEILGEYGLENFDQITSHLGGSLYARKLKKALIEARKASDLAK